jgi:hypothetical protein
MKLTPELKRAAFLQLLKNEHVPAPKLEYVFCTERKFAADYYWDINGVRLMLELQGGVEPAPVKKTNPFDAAFKAILSQIKKSPIDTQKNADKLSVTLAALFVRMFDALSKEDKQVKIGGHTSYAGMQRDRTKLNLASTHHIFTMQVSYRELTLPATILQIKKILKL